MTRDEQSEVLYREGVQDIYWHGYVSYVGTKDGNPVCGVVAYDGKLIVSVRPMSFKDHQDMIKWVQWKEAQSRFDSLLQRMQEPGAREQLQHSFDMDVGKLPQAAIDKTKKADHVNRNQD